ncbi:MAG: glycosyltransferase [Candidatus Peregrinibacteria bacterium]
MQKKYSLPSARIAIVADWLTANGGAEKVLESFAKIFPTAEFFTTVYLPENFPFLKNRTVHTSWLNTLPRVLKKRHQVLFPFLPSALESLDLRGFDLVISSSSFIAKAVITSPEAHHICYCHTPTRYFWDEWQTFLQEGLNIPSFLRPFRSFFPFLFTRLRPWDFLSAQRPDIFIANSEYVQKRIQKYYRRESLLLRPPVNFQHFQKGITEEKGESFIALGRLIPYKKFDLLVKTFAELPQKKLMIAGTGPEMDTLKKLAENADNISFLGFVPDADLPALLGKARAFLFPQLEDAGIAPMEALATGTPVIAFARGGSEGLVEEGENGIFFEAQTVESLTEALQQFEVLEPKFLQNREKIQKNMEKQSTENFEKNFLELV